MNKLIELAKKKGFDPKSHLIETLNPFDDEFIKYLWMCLLQKWLRDECNLNLEVWRSPICSEEEYSFVWHLLGVKYYNDSPKFSTYEQALEAGLTKALQLIGEKK